MSISRFVFLVISLYIASVLFGAAIQSSDTTCLFGSSIWIGISLFVFPIFRKKKDPEGVE